MSFFKSRAKPKQPPTPQRTEYSSNPIPIPSDFLTSPPAKPVISTPVPFASSGLPEYATCTALTLDNVLSPEECKQLLQLAESSVADASRGGDSAWTPALVNMGQGWEAPAPGYRESDRIIWDQQTISDRIWERCAQAEGLRELLAEVPIMKANKGKFVFHQVNKRLRFLKYTKGNYFKPHCDGVYGYIENNIEYSTRYTLQLYLSDSKKESSTGDGHVGGATSFLSRDEKRRIDINPKAGSVLIFQHANLLHEGAEVKKGVKYALRTDIVYERKYDVVEEEAKAGEAKGDENKDGATKGDENTKPE